MSATLDTAREVYISGLRNQHAVENQAVELLERQIGRLENYPEMADRMRQHLGKVNNRQPGSRRYWPA
jgi:ferritin-like metal-binding protein YciE